MQLQWRRFQQTCSPANLKEHLSAATITDLAKFFGLSTSTPRANAMEDGDNQPSRIRHAVTMTVFASDLHMHLNLHDRFDSVFPCEAGVGADDINSRP